MVVAAVTVTVVVVVVARSSPAAPATKAGVAAAVAVVLAEVVAAAVILVIQINNSNDASVRNQLLLCNVATSACVYNSNSCTALVTCNIIFVVVVAIDAAVNINVAAFVMAYIIILLIVVDKNANVIQDMLVIYINIIDCQCNIRYHTGPGLVPMSAVLIQDCVDKKIGIGMKLWKVIMN